MYHICTISDILRQGVNSLAQWLEHWISTPAVRVRIPSGMWDIFQTMHHFLFANFIFVRWGLEMDHLSHIVIKNDIIVIINGYFLEMGVCYVPLYHSFI